MSDTVKTELTESTLAEMERACARARMVGAPDDARLVVNLKLRGGKHGASAIKSVVVELPSTVTPVHD